ncbi:histidine kinase [Kitasatospora sp. NPDC051853]|uniref:histidine kinase n=1 Tax=Kitasatospora sp. NPDC051853 TaxID=3364058 RepID=UPI0037B6DF41
MSGDDNVLFYTFKDPTHTFEAFHDVTRLPGVAGAAILQRSAEGYLDIADSFAPDTGRRTLTFSAVGALLGLLGGPVGLALGLGAGAVLGSAGETKDAQDALESLTVISALVDDGGNLLVASVKETDPAAADEIAVRLGGEVARIPSEEVEAEVRMAQRKAEEAVKADHEEQRRQEYEEFAERLRHLFRGEPRDS